MKSSPLFNTHLGQRSVGIGLLLLRFGAGLILFLKHGLEKLTGYSTMVQHFPDPLHVGAHFAWLPPCFPTVSVRSWCCLDWPLDLPQR